MPQTSKFRLVLWTLVAILVLASLRLAHIHLLWADEDYHLAAAIQLLHGRWPYRDFWYDKPPGSALYYLLIAGRAGWPLRLLDTAYILCACVLIGSIARRLFNAAAGWQASLLLAFFTAFYLPSAVIPFAADALLLVPHLAAVYCAITRRPWLAGLMCGIGFWVNTKAIVVLAVCALFLGPQTLALLSGFALTVVAGAAWLWMAGAWPGYLEQVWRWGLRYAAGAPVAHPFLNGLARTGNWLGFHIVLLTPALLAIRWRWAQVRLPAFWVLLSFAAVSLGSRFAPHYFLQLLPALVILAVPGLQAAWQRRPRLTTYLFFFGLLLPVARFGPHYAQLTYDNLSHSRPAWTDAAMDLDSQQAADFLNSRKHLADTLMVWGYRPDIYVYSRLLPDGRFWDSQPLTGVAADRHLNATTAIYGEPARLNRAELTHTHPTWIVDGLSRFNPKLAMTAYPELRSWLSGYHVAGQTRLSVIYHRNPEPFNQP